jgi:cyclopropane fatty-acyl-phospholipid synthase-like methyltransferase
LPLASGAARQRAAIAAILLVVAEMVERGSKVLDVGCGDGDLLRLLESRGIDGRGIELSREGVNAASPRALRWCRATPTPTSSIIPTMPSTT